MIISDETIVLGSMKHSESNKIVTLFSKNHGKIRVIAKGARKQSSALGASLEILTICESVIYYKTHGALHLLSKSAMLHSMYSLHTTYDKLLLGMVFVEILLLWLPEEAPNEELFLLTKEYFLALNDCDNDRIFLLYFIAMIQFFECIGFALHLNLLPIGEIDSMKDCSYCYNSLNDSIEEITESTQHCFALSYFAVRYLQQCSSQNFQNELTEISLPTQNICKELHNFFVHYIRSHFHKHVKLQTELF
jgi:DNA repair protein RecO